MDDARRARWSQHGSVQFPGSLCWDDTTHRNEWHAVLHRIMTNDAIHAWGAAGVAAFLESFAAESGELSLQTSMAFRSAVDPHQQSIGCMGRSLLNGSGCADCTRRVWAR